jgi:hypothetical protein
MISTRPASSYRGPFTAAAPPVQFDWLSGLTTIPAGTWLTQMMAAQKLVEAVWHQSLLTLDTLQPRRGDRT